MAPTASKPEMAEMARWQRSGMTEPLACPALVELLKRRDTYPDRPKYVSLVETHISWVFITDRFVYKLKKPVQFDFVDFSEPETRRRACQAECELNRRLAPNVYLGVFPVTAEATGRLALNGRGRPVDWVVKMRRLPAGRMLDELIRTGGLTNSDRDRCAMWLAKYYHRLLPVFIGTCGYRQAIKSHVLNNLSELLDPQHGLPPEAVKRCHAAQLRFIAIEHEQLDGRVCDGRIVDGHGDLRPEHICLEDEPVAFDCVEFSEALRRVDVADELAFLAMECDYLGADQVAQAIVDAYRRVSGDHFGVALESFYKCYRACVRAKVAALAAKQAVSSHDHSAHERALAYLNLASGYSDQLGPPTAIVVCGLMGSGKTTLATALHNLLGSDYIGTDAIRRDTLGASPSPAAFNEGHYMAPLRQDVYSEMFRRAEALLQQRVSVVLDGIFLTAAQRTAAVALARASGAVPLIVHCVCPTTVALERIEDRSAEPSLSEARTELYASQQYEEEPISGADSIEVDTTATLCLQEAAVLGALRRHAVSNRNRAISYEPPRKT